MGEYWAPRPLGIRVEFQDHQTGTDMGIQSPLFFSIILFKGWVDGYTDIQMMHTWMGGCMDGWIHQWMDKCMHVCLHEQMHGQEVN